MEHFKTLHVNNNYSSNALETKYKLNEITSDMVVVRDVLAKEYLLFQSRDQFWAYYDSLGQKFFEEVIFGHLPQFPKFDIDIKDISSSDKDSVIDILRQIISAIKDTSSDIYQCTINTVMVLESSGISNKKWKYSFHIVLPQYAFHNNEEAKTFYDRLVCHLPKNIATYVDDVNKSIQNFRMYGSSKFGENRPFVLSPLSEQLGTLTIIEDNNHLLVTANTCNFFTTKITSVTSIEREPREPVQDDVVKRCNCPC